MASLTLASPSFLSSGLERLRPTELTARKCAIKSVTSVTASCRPTWQSSTSSQQFNRARQAAAMAAKWQAMGCQPGMSFRTDPGAWWTEGAQRGRGGNPLEEIFSQLAGVKGYQVEEREDGWILRFELPGLSFKDVKVQVENEQVLLIGQPGRTTRIALPDRCHVAGLQARLRFGLLTVTLPRTAPSRDLRDVTISEGEDDDVAVRSDDVAEKKDDMAENKNDMVEKKNAVADKKDDVVMTRADVVGPSADVVSEKGDVAGGEDEVEGEEEGKKTEGGEEDSGSWKDGVKA